MSKRAKLIAVLVIGFFLILSFSMMAVISSQFGGHAYRSSEPYVAVVEVSGVIMDSSEFRASLKDLLEDDELKAIVVRINSPGGLVAPSEEIYYALKKADEKVPVIASMGSLAASGGYYAALGARKVYANAGTLTGSIGVIMELANTERLYEWAKVERYTLKAGKFKDIGSSSRKMTPEERELMQSLLDNMHKDFRDKVQKNRKLTDDELNSVADGRIFTGLQAKSAKLVDEIGPMSEALAEAKRQGGLKEDAYVHYPKEEEGLVRKLLLGARGSKNLTAALDKLGTIVEASFGPQIYFLWPGF